jgi:glucose/arabinose dehydrogenase
MRTSSLALLIGILLGACTAPPASSGALPAAVSELLPSAIPDAKTKHIYVVQGDYSTISGAILTFPLTASGNVKPTAVVTGSSTLLRDIVALTVTPAGAVIVANGSLICCPQQYLALTFPASANGNVKPASKLVLPSPPTALSVAPGGDLFAGTVQSDDFHGRIGVYPPGASGKAKPVRTLQGSNTNLYAVGGIAFDSHGQMIVTGDNTDIVSTFVATASGNVPPVRSFLTDSAYPHSIVVGPKGFLYVNVNSQQLEMYAANTTGQGQTVRKILPFKQGDIYQGIAVDSAGYIYTLDYDTNSIYVFAPNASGTPTPVRTISGKNTRIDHATLLVIR